jgi:2-succinyl-5-enolpyruvyl-6-hydroxy-3-cyclohexene-1-carboxylate synthase
VARALAAVLAPGTTLVVSSSMPVRDLEWYTRPRDALRVLANRGANGIDGVVSTAVGVALAGGARSALLIGDLAFLHDANGLLGLAGRGVELTIVVVDNRGGGIFSFLPPARALAPDRFETLFGTPHDVDLAALARLHGLAATAVNDAGELEPALEEAVVAGGVQVVVVGTDRGANVALHDEIHAEVVASLRAT